MNKVGLLVLALMVWVTAHYAHAAQTVVQRVGLPYCEDPADMEALLKIHATQGFEAVHDAFETMRKKINVEGRPACERVVTERGAVIRNVEPFYMVIPDAEGRPAPVSLYRFSFVGDDGAPEPKVYTSYLVLELDPPPPPPPPSISL